MKTTLSTTVFSGLLAVLAAAISGQAVSAPFPTEPFMLAESGSDRLMEYRLLREELAQARATRGESERFAQVLEEQPTAAGPQFESEDAQPLKQALQYKSPILRERAEQGLH